MDCDMVMKRGQDRFVPKIGLFVVFYLLLALLMYWVVADDWTRATVDMETVSQGYLLPADQEIAQSFICPADGLNGISLVPHFDQAERSGTVTLSISENGKQLWHTDIETAAITSDTKLLVSVEPVLENVRS